MSQDNPSVRIDALNQHIAEGKILEAMETFYGDGVVMTEPYHTTEGKAENIEREKQFLASVAEWHVFEAKATAVVGDVSLSEQVMAWTTTEGQKMHVEQVAVARWKDGKIVHERFYYSTN